MTELQILSPALNTYMVQTCKDESVDGDPVVLVLLVGIGALEAQTRQHRTEEVRDQSKANESSAPIEVV